MSDRRDQPDDTEAVFVELTDAETRLLRAGLLEWSGPARPTEELAAAMGYGSVEGLYAETKRLRGSVENQQPLSPLDWTKLLAAVEIAFGSDVFGSGYEWMTTTGLDDYETLRTLRALQGKLVRFHGPAVGTLLGTRPQRR
jgi:hypothetical protein